MKFLGYDLSEIIEKEKFIRKLSAKKRRFVEIFCTTLDVSKTAKMLEMRVNTAYNMLKKEDVQKAIQYTQEIISFRNAITQDYFIEKLKEIIEDKSIKPSERISALQLMARITGHIKERPVETQQLVILKQEGLKSEKEEDLPIITIASDS